MNTPEDVERAKREAVRGPKPCAIATCTSNGRDPDGLCFWHFLQWMGAKEFRFSDFKARVEREEA